MDVRHWWCAACEDDFIAVLLGPDGDRRCAVCLGPVSQLEIVWPDLGPSEPLGIG